MYRYSNMAPRISGQNCKFFKLLLSLNSQKRQDTDETTANIEVCPESLGAMFEYWYIERDLLVLGVKADPYLASRSSLPTTLPPVGTSAMDASNSEIPKKRSIPIDHFRYIKIQHGSEA